MKPETSPRPENVAPRDVVIFRRKALNFFEARRFAKKRIFTTGDLNVPSWVLGELYAEGKINGEKRGYDQPNMWWMYP